MSELGRAGPPDAPPQARPLLEGSGGVEPGWRITGPALGGGVRRLSSKVAQGLSFTLLWKEKRMELFKSSADLLVSASGGLSCPNVGPLSSSRYPKSIVGAPAEILTQTPPPSAN